MPTSNSTCWLLIEGAAAGRPEDRAEFARRYAPVVRAYLGARWSRTPRRGDIDDTVQEVFLECFREGGVLERSDRDREGGFRAFFYGVVRNVARRLEERAARDRARMADEGTPLDAIESDEATLSRTFDRAWARALLRQAFEVLETRAAQEGSELAFRVALLKRRYRDDIPIREIARESGSDAKALHRALDRAKKEFQAALAEVVALHSPGTASQIAERCREILSLVR